MSAIPTMMRDPGGHEAELANLLLMLQPGLPTQAQQDCAGRLREVVMAVAAAPAAVARDESLWTAWCSDGACSIFGPEVLIAAGLRDGEVIGIHLSAPQGVDCQIDFPPVPPDASTPAATTIPLLRVRLYQDGRCVSDHCFEADGSITDARDWRQRIQEGLAEIDRTFARFPQTDGADAALGPPASGGLDEAPSPPASADVIPGRVLEDLGRMAAGAVVAMSGSAVVKPPATQWYYMTGSAQQGPVSEDELRSLLCTGLSPESLVWHRGLDQWTPARVMNLCAGPPPSPPMLPGSAGCPHCGVSVPVGTRFCGTCGKPQTQKPTAPTCPKCGQPLAKATAKFCGHCGAPTT